MGRPAKADCVRLALSAEMDIGRGQIKTALRLDAPILGAELCAVGAEGVVCVVMCCICHVCHVRGVCVLCVRAAGCPALEPFCPIVCIIAPDGSLADTPHHITRTHKQLTAPHGAARAEGGRHGEGPHSRWGRQDHPGIVS